MNEILMQCYIAELQKIYDAENQLIAALPTMATMAASDDLREGLELHLEETKQHRDRVGEIIKNHGADPDVETSRTMEALINEGEILAKDIPDTDVRNAAIISGARKIEHAEIAMYEGVRGWAKHLGHSEDASTLESIQDQEQGAQAKLKGLAEGGLFKTGVNKEAAEV